jgi:hypothetical protein
MKNIVLLALLFLTIIACSDSDSNDVIDSGNNPPDGVDISLNKKALGESANDLLANTKFDKLVVEVMFIDGFQPTSTAINNFKTFLEQRLNKGSVIITQRNIGVSTKNIYSINDIKELEDNNRQKFNSDDEIAVSGLFVNGEYSENTSDGKVLGVAYRNTSFVIFEETVKSFSTGVLAPSVSTLESVVINHEFGHILGLVNVGSPMQNNHQDIAHGRHCTDEACLMYWTAETGEGLINMLSGGSVPNLDDQCIADLQANGGK